MTALAASVTPPHFAKNPEAPLRPINWNRMSDEKD